MSYNQQQHQSSPHKQQQPISHLPVLYNPFLNCIFNNPHFNKSPFKSVIEELRANHNEYTLIVPSSYVLNEYYDPSTQSNSTKTLLKEFCYNNEDFIKSHIIKTSTPVSSTVTPISKEQSVIYNTLSSKQILIKNRMIYTGKGFRRSLKLKISHISYFHSFSDYFPQGSKFMLIHIESTLIGGVPNRKSLPPIPPPSSSASGTSKSSKDKSLNLDSITFEKLLRSFPLLSKAVSDKFYKLFHHNNKKFRVLRTYTRKPLDEIRVEFRKMLDEAFKIISDSVKVENPDSEQTYSLINHIISMFPGIDLNKLVHEYVELNLYDVLWSQLIFQFNFSNDDKETYDKEAIKILTTEKYRNLSCLSLNQLDLPIEEPWKLNELYERVSLAIKEFEKLSDSSIVISTSKTNIIYNTVKILSRDSWDLTINADILISLMIMVIAHSKVDNLEAHIYYIRNFNSVDHHADGHFNYIMSNLDAVLYHMSGNEAGYIDLMSQSNKNYQLWNSIYEQDIEKLQEIIDEVSDEFPNCEVLPDNHFLNSRNINGESCIAFAIRSKNYDIYNLLMNTNPGWFSIDTVLFDMNVVTKQNLLTLCLIEETDPRIMDDLVSIILSNSTPEESAAYFNSIDKSGRSVGHYLFHNYKLIDSIGQYIDWELKDSNSHTPLFSLCRCYDHPDYVDLIKHGFACVYEKYGRGNLDFDKHVDKSGNTLLHVILKGIPETELLSNEGNIIDINQTSQRNMTPLMLYVKYNRLENLQEILKDSRLDFLFEDLKNHYNVFDYLGFSAAKSLKTEVFGKMEACIFDYYLDNYFPRGAEDNLVAMNGKYDSNKKDWLIFLRNSDAYCNYRSINNIKQRLFITKLKYPLSTFPDEETFWKNFPIDIPTSPMFHKFRINRFIENLNILFRSLVFQSNINRSVFFKSFLSVEVETSILDIKKKIGESIERNKIKKFGEDVTYKTNQIYEIEYFLEYSLTDLNKYKTLFSKLAKLIAFAELKQTDANYVEDQALFNIIPKSNLCDNTLRSASQIAERDSSWNTLLGYITWIQATSEELLKNINKIMQEIRSWKEVYHSICILNSELKQIEKKSEKSEQPVANTDAVPVENGNTEENGEDGGTISRTISGQTLSINPIPENEIEEDTAFFSFGERRKTKYKKLIVAKSEKVKQIMKLNFDIRWGHEIIAAEISNFLKFRTEFLRFGIKVFNNGEIRRLKQRKLELQSILKDLK
ncbi:uncharacterized protein J8A68_003577 [[Candida] subhashii]|uniref:VPS9 domain-containing protein n=1 Tax=[Candida] subhashii TaxID=561895 RepID=A0A8J5QIW0_9ASCO|nr:uncharacterized protein J8A68_003577 [[Candida] subhashii]KAG7662893.1 hypothetical protein J8A68_003577 [[Candida] subhashii]